MALVPISSRGVTSWDPLGVALGAQYEPFPMGAITNANSLISQEVFGTALYASAGSTITGMKLRNGTAAAGTVPTTVRAGLCDFTGKVLALSGNANAAATWAAGVVTIPFTAPIVLTYSGIYFPSILVNGGWGTTQPTPAEAVPSNSNLVVADGALPPFNYQWVGQVDLPAVGALATITTPSTRSYYLALY